MFGVECDRFFGLRGDRFLGIEEGDRFCGDGFWSAIAFVGWVEQINMIDTTYRFDETSETQHPQRLLLVGFGH
jgi:hypothetical protein